MGDHHSTAYSLFPRQALTTVMADLRPTAANPLHIRSAKASIAVVSHTGSSNRSTSQNTKFKPAMKSNPRSSFYPTFMCINGADQETYTAQRSSTLSAFSTPGFQTRKQYPAQHQTNQDAISISSGSTSSSPQQYGVKRDSSGFSILDGVSTPLKRPKILSNEEKENVFPDSVSVNMEYPAQQTRDDSLAVETVSSFSDLTQVGIPLCHNKL